MTLVGEWKELCGLFLNKKYYPKKIMTMLLVEKSTWPFFEWKLSVAVSFSGWGTGSGNKLCQLFTGALGKTMKIIMMVMVMFSYMQCLCLLVEKNNRVCVCAVLTVCADGSSKVTSIAGTNWSGSCCCGGIWGLSKIVMKALSQLSLLSGTLYTAGNNILYWSTKVVSLWGVLSETVAKLSTNHCSFQ